MGHNAESMWARNERCEVEVKLQPLPIASGGISMLGWALAAALALQASSWTTTTAVAQVPGKSLPAAAYPAAELGPVSPGDVMAVPPELRSRVHELVLAGNPSLTVRFQRVANFLVDEKGGLGIQYDESATLTVAQAYAARKANCLTFTLLVLALAKEVGLEAYPQEIGETLSWREVDGTIYRENHINAGVRIGGHRYSVDPAADLIFLPRPPVQVTHERLLAHYYNNIAVDQLQEGHTDIALQDIAVAEALDPNYGTLWSNAGVMALHGGDAATAERDYSRALSLNPTEPSALFNMVQILHRSRDPREIDFRRRLSRVEQRDPLQQFLQSLDYERAGDLPRAIECAHRAIQLKPGEHRFYAELARLYQHEGDVIRARAALASAHSFSQGAQSELYRIERDGLGPTATR